MIFLKGSRLKARHVPFYFNAADCIDEQGIFALGYGKRLSGVFTRASRKRLLDQNGRMFAIPNGSPPLGIVGGENAMVLEPAAINACLRSDDLTHSAWSKNDSTITADAAAGPDGTIIADLVTEGVAGNAFVLQQFTVAAGATYCFSKVLRRGNHDWVRIVINDQASPSNHVTAWFNLATGQKGAAMATGGVGVAGRAEIENLGGGRYRCAVSGSLTGITAYQVLTLSAAGDASTSRVNNSTRYESSAQMETGLVPTSYMPTVASTASRATELLYFDAPGLNPARAVTIYARHRNIGWVANQGVTRRIAHIGATDAGIDPRMGMQIATSGAWQGYVDDAVSSTFTNSGVPDLGAVVESRNAVNPAAGTMNNGRSFNGAAENVSSVSGKVPFTSWGGTLVLLGQDGPHHALTHLLVAFGEYTTLDPLRELAGI